MVVLVAVIGATITVARQQPIPERLAVLHFDRCEPPCWIGITPGITTLDETINKLNIIYPQPNYNVVLDKLSSGINQAVFSIYTSGKIFGVVVFHASGEQIIDSIQFYVGRRSNTVTYITYADLHHLWGVPSYLKVELGSWKNGIVYILDKGRITAMSHPEYVNGDGSLQNTRVQTIIFSRSHEDSFRTFGEIDWRGFLPFSRYKHRFCLEQGCD